MPRSTTDRTSLPERLLRLLWCSRQGSGKSQHQIAQEAGISQTQYWKIENGFAVPDAATWRGICRALGQPGMIPLLSGDEDQIPTEVTIKVPKE